MKYNRSIFLVVSTLILMNYSSPSEQKAPGLSAQTQILTQQTLQVPIPTVTPTPFPLIIQNPAPSPSSPPIQRSVPAPTPTPVIPATLEIMSGYDYIKNSVTGITTEKVSLTSLQKSVKDYGKLYGVGMPYKEYKDALSYHWVDCTDYKNKPVNLTVDLTKSIDYDGYVTLLKKLSRYEGVYLYKIGNTTKGQNLYAIEIDVPSAEEKKVFMFTGQVHAREFAGGTFLLKQFVDLVQKAQTDKNTMEILKKNKYVAVPIINIDGREALMKAKTKWTVKGEMWKAYLDGTDGNRNFPGLIWGQVTKGNHLRWDIAKKPGYAYYPGVHAGSSKETKALMKWIYHYSVVDKAICLIDLHQQGSYVYAGKEWSLKQMEQSSINLRKDIFHLLNPGNKQRTYGIIQDGPVYGFEGTGSTITDYAASVAFGAKFSPAMGFCAFTDGQREYMLMEVKDMDHLKFKVKIPNRNFRTLTIEIGRGKNYLGNSTATRKLLADEYRKYHFEKLLEQLPGMVQ